jgi:DNA-binding LacI/PurR family transcriptional regulator
MQKRPPLKLIAEYVGVSKMTVSRALREGTSVDPDVRAKVRAAAFKLGYSPDTRISQVMSAIRKSEAPHYRENLAFIWTHRLNGKPDEAAFMQEEFEGARRRTQELGYKLEEFRMSGPSLNGRILSRILHSRGVRGALIAPPSFERSHPHIRLEWNQLCCVLMGRSFANVGLPRVEHDYYFSCMLAVRRLRRLRYKRIGLVLSHSMDARSAHLIRSAFLSFHPLGLKEAQKLIYISDKYEPKMLKRWIGEYQPDVFLANFETEFPRKEQLSANAPKSVGFASLNWRESEPGIAGINQHRAAIGEQAVDLLLLRLQGSQFGLDALAPSIKVPGSWMEGTSLRPVKAVPATRKK